MDYDKLDAALALTLERAEDPGQRFPVFVHARQPGAAVPADLVSRLGTDTVGGVHTAMLTRDDIDRLSEEPWVKSLHLSLQRRPT
jgi:hypothetical protein